MFLRALRTGEHVVYVMLVIGVIMFTCSVLVQSDVSSASPEGIEFPEYLGE